MVCKLEPNKRGNYSLVVKPIEFYKQKERLAELFAPFDLDELFVMDYGCAYVVG